MHLITKYYNYSAKVLDEYLPMIPEVKLTEAKSYYGKITRRNGKFTRISLSKWCLDAGSPHMWDKDDYEDLIDTICHEFAHMFYWEHGDNHTNLTEKFKALVFSNLKLTNLRRIYENSNN